MTNKTALKALLVKVEAGDLHPSEIGGLAAQIWKPESAGGHCTFMDVERSYHGDHTAAADLLSATLPGWLHVWGIDREGPFAYLHQSGPNECDVEPGEECRAKNEARALLIAIIKKLIEQEG